MLATIRRYLPVFLTLIICLRISSCADDDVSFQDGIFMNSSATFADGLILSWSPPASYSDSTYLDPIVELDVYEIYVNRTGVFFPDDEPTAYVSATDTDGKASESFDLGMLEYPFQTGQTYHVSMRSVTKVGGRSDYSTVFTFTIQDGSDPSMAVDQFLCRIPAHIPLTKHRS